MEILYVLHPAAIICVALWFVLNLYVGLIFSKAHLQKWVPITITIVGNTLLFTTLAFFVKPHNNSFWNIMILMSFVLTSASYIISSRRKEAIKKVPQHA